MASQGLFEFGASPGESMKQLLASSELPVIHQDITAPKPPLIDRPSLLHAPNDISPPFPCIECDKCFRRRNEWARHGTDIHQPELKLYCPHVACNRRFTRRYRLERHLGLLHGSSSTAVPASQLRTAPVEKVWACGFCVSCSATWDDLTKHIWSHFKAGSLKSQWSTSTYIQSLLQHSSVRFDWQALIHNRINVSQIEWSAPNIEELRSELEWIRPDRKTGLVLARMACDRLKTSGDHNLPVQANLSYPFDAVPVSDPGIKSSMFSQAETSDTSFTYGPNTTLASTIEMDWSHLPADNSVLERLEFEVHEESEELAFADIFRGSADGLDGDLDDDFDEWI